MKVKVLLLGHNGMLGNAVYKYLQEDKNIELVTMTKRWGDAGFEGEIKLLSPDYIINCIGKIPQKKPTAEDYKFVNIDLPLFLDGLGIKIIHPTTDCEFKGSDDKNFLYKKSSLRNVEDEYGKSKAEASKYLEHKGKNTKIIRVSIIGHELSSYRSLLDWFLNSGGYVKGYQHHLWNGITTLTWAKICKDIMFDWNNFPKLNQYGTEKIYSKYDMLILIKDVYNKDIEIEPYSEVTIVNKCLASDMIIPDLDTQLKELKSFYNNK